MLNKQKHQLLSSFFIFFILRYETAGLVSVTRSMDIAVAYVIQVNHSKECFWWQFNTWRGCPSMASTFTCK